MCIINGNLMRGGKKVANKMVNLIAKGTAGVLDKCLKADANSTTCGFVYQPKAPKELTRYRKTK